MNKSKQTTAFLIAAVLILAASISALTVSAEETTTVSLADFEANPASTIKAPLMIYNVTDVVGGELNTSFDPSVVHVTDISEGDIGTTTSNINNEAGWAYMNVFGVEGKSGDVLFAYLTLKAVGSEGEKSSLNISVISLFNTNYMDISYKTDNGTFAIRDITPPASISNLRNATGNFWINWTWTNPSDYDFNHTMVYLDGTWQTNTSYSYYNATGLNPDTTYEIGTHTVDTSGNVNNTLVNQTAKTLALNSAPVADPNGPYTGMEGVAILFNGSGSYDLDGSIVAYEWDFGDGNTSSEVNPTHTYAQDGIYAVTLTVTDNDGATNTSITAATIADTEPIADFIATPTSGQKPLTVTFSDNTTSHDGIIAWEWDFNNDSVTDSTVQNPTYVYAEDGVYTVSLKVSESDGDSNTITKADYITVTKANNPPFKPANPSPSDGATDVSIDADLSWTGGDPDAGDTVTYDVYFGTSTSPPLVAENQPETTYDPGTLDHSTKYYWQIVATDNHGASNESDVWSFTTKASPGTDLIGLWHLDEGTGEIAADSSEYGNDGILVNDPMWVDGKLGKALSFDGVADYVDCGHDASLDIADEITIMVWVKPNVAGEGGPNAGPVCKDEAGVDWSWQLRYNAPGGGNYMGFQFNGVPEGSTWVSVKQDLSPGDWYHIAGTFDGTNIKCYLNGIEKDTNQISAIKSGNSTFFIGQDGWNNIFNGIVDEVKIYNWALGAEEIIADYEAGSSNHPPTAFIYSITPDPAEQGKDTISFTGHGTDTDGSVVAYNWRSSIDGLLSTASSFSKPASELSAGTHTIYFKVQDDDGAWSTEITEDLRIIEPANPAPVSDPNGPYTGTEGVPIAYDGSGSYDLDGSIVAYEWDFGDGNAATGVNPTHTYAQDGIYTVTLTVTDNDGATNTSITAATIADIEPVADFSAMPTSGLSPLTVAFTDASTSHDGIEAWSWDFDSDSLTDSTEQNPAYEYTEGGVYTVSLTVTESDGDSDTMTKADYITVTKANQPPISDPNGPYTGTEGVAIAFDGSTSLDPDGSIVAYLWTFGDGNNATGATPTHTYTQNGTYTVTLTVTDNDGATNTNTTTATIADTEPNADFSAMPTSGLSPLTVAFTDASTSHDGIEAWSWDFDSDSLTDSTEQNPAYEYTEGGVYTVSLTVTESDGDSDTMTKADYITVAEMNQIEYIWLEAEDADILTPDFEIASDTSASNGEYIQIPEGVGFRAHDGEATYTISIDSLDDYVIWGRKIAATDNDNSFFVQIDDGTRYLWTTALSDNWQWDTVNHWGSGGEFDPEIDPVVFTLSAGEHTLKILQREDGAKLDKLLITNDMSYVPVSNQPPTAIIDSITPDPAEQGKDTVSFTGHGTDTDGSIVAYHWSSSIDGQLSTASSFSKPASELSVGSHTIYFKVQDDEGAWSTEITEDLTIIEPANQPPNMPAEPSPSDSATDVPIDADLSWTGGDPDAGDTVTYDVYFGTTTTPPLVAENQMGTTYDPGTLDHSTLYYWQIVATDNHGATAEGEVWTFTTAAAPDTPPIVSNPSATPDTILNDNGRPRIPGTNISQLSVTVTDDTEVDTVTIDLSPIGVSYEAQMTNIPGTDTWTITTNAVEGINIAHDLIVTATDTNANSDSSVSIQLTILRRGDVDHDNDVDHADALAIKKYIKGLAPDPGVFIGDVYPATGDNVVDEMDVLYMREYVSGKADEP